MLRAPRDDDGSRWSTRRALTRKQICEAANDLFVRTGFPATTMEQIARAADIRRSTLYTHFADKEQILAAIGADYVIDVCDMIRRLPGPVPDSAAIEAWVNDFAEFVAVTSAPAELIMAVGRQADVPAEGATFGATMMRCFA